MSWKPGSAVGGWKANYSLDLAIRFRMLRVSASHGQLCVRRACPCGCSVATATEFDGGKPQHINKACWNCPMAPCAL